MKRPLVRVRLLQAVTYGDGPAWLPDSVQHVAPALAAHMVSAGEAVYVIGRETTIAVHTAPERTR